MQNRNTQHTAAFLRIAQIIGNPNAEPPIPALIPIGRSTWWQWVRDGKAPAPVKLGLRTTAWKSSDISALIDSLNATQTGGQHCSPDRVSGKPAADRKRIAEPDGGQSSAGQK